MPLPQIGKNDWYHWGQRTRVSPFPTIISMAAMCKELSEYVGVSLNQLIVLFQNKEVHYFMYQDDLASCAQAILQKLKSDPFLYKRLSDLQSRIGPELINVARQSTATVSPMISNQELLAAYQDYRRAYRPVYASYGSVWVVENALQEHLRKIVETRIPDPAANMETLNALTIEPSTHVVSQEQEALLRLAATILDTPEWHEQLKQRSLYDLDHDLFLRIQQHAHNFSWVSRDYEDRALTPPMVLDRLKPLLDQNPKILYQTILERRRIWLSEREQSLNQMQVSVDERALFDAMRDIVALKALRKRYVSESLYWLDPILQEIGRRLKCTLAEVRYLLEEDLIPALANNQFEPSLVQKRMQSCAWYINSEGAQELTDSMVKELQTLIKAKTPGVKVIHGMPVSPGRAKGKVRIVLSPADIANLEPGEVLVCIQIQPNIGPILKQTAALVCDGGHGITSHPATLSREAGIPAVIQTKNARNILKNGDLVEVDGYAGTVTLIEQDKRDK